MKLLFFVSLMTCAACCFGQQTAQAGDVRVAMRWGATGSFNIGTLGDLGKTSEDVKSGYGGELGAVCGVFWNSCWFVESSVVVSICDYKFKICGVGRNSFSLTRYACSGRCIGGYRFGLNDHMQIAPVVSMDITYNFANHVSGLVSCGTCGDIWRPFDVAPGFGVEFFTDKASVGVIGYIGIINQRRDSAPTFMRRHYNSGRASVSIKYYI